MTELYVRMEAVNLANFIEDVHDLSTIRGGSFLLLEAVEAVEERFRLKRISTGASIGLFATGSDQSASTVQSEMEAFLRTHDRFRHATFVVDVKPANDFTADRESLAAMNRWRQFQQPTLAVPTVPAAASNDECRFDHVRPAATTAGTPTGPQRVSTSVAVRRTKGRDRKQTFYAEELKRLDAQTGSDPALEKLIADVEGTSFANDLELLTSDETRKRLHAKMAVLYFDGNQFGQRQRSCGRPDELRRFDEKVKRCRRSLLRALLDDVLQSRSNGWWTSDGAVRLETLLWGGDELLWVVPAWKGWDVVRLFYEQSRQWEHDGKPLTHAGGVVFCHHTAPIHRMTRTSHDLAELCKTLLLNTNAGDSHDESDVFAYQVFESFDLVEGTLDSFRRKRVPLEGGDSNALILHAAGMESVADDCDVVRRSFPRSKLHEIVLALRHPEGDAKRLVAGALSRLRQNERESLDRIFQFFGRTTEANPWETDPTGWFHLADLWDYVVA